LNALLCRARKRCGVSRIIRAMIALETALPAPVLRDFVRIYAQRRVTAFESGAAMVVEPFPARLEQTLEFQFGELFQVHHWNGESELTDHSALVGAHVDGCTRIDLQPGVVSFAIFFNPTGYSRLFNFPAAELANRNYDAALISTRIGHIRERLGECQTFAARVKVIESFLISHLANLSRNDATAVIAEHIFKVKGAVLISKLASGAGLSLRQFERNFVRDMGFTPKLFARVARFQAALDEKLVHPFRSWADIAHHLGYFDQMHMVRDFELLGGATPRHVLQEIGDARPMALPPHFTKK
jgi:AraC-like DNA-binding protein